MKKHNLFAYALVPMLGLGLFGTAGIASAQGFGFGMIGSNAVSEDIAERHQQMFEKQASFLGVSVSDVKSAWATGKSMQTLANEKGINKEAIKAKIEAERKAHMTAQLQTLVSKGVITQAQADSRLKFIEGLPKGGKRKGGMGMHGQGRGFGF